MISIIIGHLAGTRLLVIIREGRDNKDTVWICIL